MFLGEGLNIDSKVGKSYDYEDTVDYVCRKGFVFNTTITRRTLKCSLDKNDNKTGLVMWNDTALQCSSMNIVFRHEYFFKLSVVWLEY